MAGITFNKPILFNTDPIPSTSMEPVIVNVTKEVPQEEAKPEIKVTIKIVSYEGHLIGCVRCSKPASYIVKEIADDPKITEDKWDKKKLCGGCTQICVDENKYHI